jgi:hypothetical protein
VVTDSPPFGADGLARAMLAGRARQFAERYGLTAVVWPGVGYPTSAGLDAAARSMALCSQFIASRGPFVWR